MVGLGASIRKLVVNVVNGLASRSASISEEPSAHEESPIAITKALPLLSSCTPRTSDPGVTEPFIPIHKRCGDRRQRWNSSSDDILTGFSEPARNSVSMIV